MKSTSFSGALPGTPVAEEPAATKRVPGARTLEPTPARPLRPAPAESGNQPIELIAIGVSTGGPQALATLLSALPETMTQAVLIVQHMADGFLEGLAQWLDSQCALPVGVGGGGKRLQPGTVTLPPAAST